ncbi:hypothetical protein I8748_27735 [Nostoc sp. CENA67]|uniref:Uncharacterized protein n=1 Tax=Amazonocrinis nigriterrae CENA67 TaxID=2794033 RepID=A0A8J7I0S3_9NOST|nr:hypothetical protein [Amazonocrinis nigriterrae]MBH8565914.1 hypothetical protein [Amazonocrinis nigriterrae CENA67]
MSKLPSGLRRVYNTLYKRKATGLISYAPTPSEIKDYFESQEFDVNNITDEQFEQAISYFTKGELSTVNQEYFDAVSSDKAEVPSSKPEAKASPESNQIIVSGADKQALVSSQSSALGFSLTEEETIAVADSIDNVFADYSAFISSVTNAIKGYIAHKFDTIENDLESSTTEVREYLNARTNQLNQKVSNFADNVKAIQTDTTAIRNNLKNSQTTIMARFRFT